MSLKKALVIFELEGCLFYSKLRKEQTTIFGHNAIERKPDQVVSKYELYYRKGRKELIENLFRTNSKFYQVGVWSSLDKESTS